MKDPGTFEIEAQLVEGGGFTANQKARMIQANAAPSTYVPPTRVPAEH